jgi:hypothetical protein
MIGCVVLTKVSDRPCRKQKDPVRLWDAPSPTQENSSMLTPTAINVRMNLWIGL